jgi:nucleoside-diphosphate-sugar epimerase
MCRLAYRLPFLALASVFVPLYGLIKLSTRTPLRRLWNICEESKGKSLLIFGCGYVGTTLARQFQSRGLHVSGTCTTKASAEALCIEGINAHVFDSTKPPTDNIPLLKDLAQASYVLHSVPPTSEHGIDPVLASFLPYLSKLGKDGTLRWFGYLSSTGVYGNATNGTWVDESSPVTPHNPKTRARTAAEHQWLRMHAALGLQTHIFRLAGIYGPGRSIIDQLLRTPPSPATYLADGTQYTSRIHVMDIVTCLLASMQCPASGNVYNVADDAPSTRKEVRAVMSHDCYVLTCCNPRSTTNSRSKM